MRKQHEHPIVFLDSKQCTQCKEIKNFSEFHKFAKSPDGYKHFCKVCVREYDLKENDPKRIYPRKYVEDKIHCRDCQVYFEPYLENTESAWDEESSSESKPIPVKDHMGKEKFWEDLGRP